MNLLEQDKFRYKGKMPFFHKCFRKAQMTNFPLSKCLWKILYKISAYFLGIDIGLKLQAGGGLYFGHPFGITVNPDAVIGNNVNLHKGVTIGAENRGKRKGAPVIGNNVWIGINATIVGNITIGNDVLIAPNTLVNFDVPDHSIVVGCPGIIKSVSNATEGYINNAVNICEVEK